MSATNGPDWSTVARELPPGHPVRLVMETMGFTFTDGPKIDCAPPVEWNTMDADEREAFIGRLSAGFMAARSARGAKS